MWKCLARSSSGIICFVLGEFIDARAYFENSLALWNPMYRAFRATADRSVIVLVIPPFPYLLCLGYIDQARLRGRRRWPRPDGSRLTLWLSR